MFHARSKNNLSRPALQTFLLVTRSLKLNSKLIPDPLLMIIMGNSDSLSSQLIFFCYYTVKDHFSLPPNASVQKSQLFHFFSLNIVQRVLSMCSARLKTKTIFICGLISHKPVTPILFVNFSSYMYLRIHIQKDLLDQRAKARVSEYYQTCSQAGLWKLCGGQGERRRSYPSSVLLAGQEVQIKT